MWSLYFFSFFFFNDPATTEIYTLSLHDALPNLGQQVAEALRGDASLVGMFDVRRAANGVELRSEEHTSELQSHVNLVCRLLLEKKKKNTRRTPILSKQCTSCP